MDDVRTLLSDQLRGEAPASRISVTRAVADGRQSIRYRRVAVSVSAAVVVSLVAVGVVGHGRPGSGAATSPSRSPLVLSSVVQRGTEQVLPSGEASPPGHGPGPVDLPRLVGGVGGAPAEIILPHGGTVALPVDPGYDLVKVVEVPTGWVYELSGVDGGVWFLPDAGSRQKIASASGGFAISGDGSFVVVAGVGDGTSGADVVAYRLPSLAVIGQTSFNPGGYDPTVRDLHGDWALIVGGDPILQPAPAPAETWNVSTGAVVPLGGLDNVWPLGVSADGKVLRRVDVVSGPDSGANCVDEVTPIVSVPTGPTGFCTTEPNVAPELAWLSPTGAWAVLGVAQGGAYAVTTADLGSQRPLQVAQLPDKVAGLFWDSDTTFILMPFSTQDYYRCDQFAECTAFTLPLGRTLVQVVGATGG